MRSSSKIFAIAVLASVVALGACGGSQDAPPGPLAQHFDDMYIAAIPLDQKQPVVQSQNDWSVAKMENAKAEADLNESTTQLTVVRNDQKATRLAVDSAVSNKKSADASADTNRINQATKDLHTAEDLAKAADERVKYYEAYREYLKVVLRHAQENMYWREGQYELAKAQLGQKNSIAPKGVAYDTFPKQEQERGKRTSSAKDRVDTAKGHALSARDNWLKAQEIADRENGHPTNLPDPMAPRSASATAGSTGSSP
jgi:tetratricopeptide (TPR) repeat protein